jgi:hypothetical protein
LTCYLFGRTDKLPRCQLRPATPLSCRFVRRGCKSRSQQ